MQHLHKILCKKMVIIFCCSPSRDDYANDAASLCIVQVFATFLFYFIAAFLLFYMCVNHFISARGFPYDGQMSSDACVSDAE